MYAFTGFVSIFSFETRMSRANLDLVGFSSWFSPNLGRIFLIAIQVSLYFVFGVNHSLTSTFDIVRNYIYHRENHAAYFSFPGFSRHISVTGAIATRWRKISSLWKIVSHLSIIDIPARFLHGYREPSGLGRLLYDGQVFHRLGQFRFLIYPLIGIPCWHIFSLLARSQPLWLVDSDDYNPWSLPRS